VVSRLAAAPIVVSKSLAHRVEFRVARLTFSGTGDSFSSVSVEPEASAELEAARQEVARLRLDNARLTAENARLSGENTGLTAENAKLTTLLDAVSDVVILASTDHRFLHLNAAARQSMATIVGVATADPIGKTPRELGMPEVLNEHVDAQIHDVLRTGGTVTRELLLPTRAGKVWRESRASPVRREDGTIWASAVISRDIHERKLSEEFRDQMISVLGHDLRNPLTAISALTAMSRRSASLPDRLGPWLEQIDKATTRALEMIKSLLQFSEGRFHGFAISPTPSDLRELGRAVIDEITAAHRGRAIELLAEGECTAECDPARIGQVLANLVSNAVAHGAGDSPVRLLVTSTPDRLDIRVTNHGPAIPPDLMAHLFEPFQRGPGAPGHARPPGSAARGLGLGLYIVREIVKAHRGSVTVTSTDRDGTCFSVSLPRAAS
jgi:PAS domain S-box-containing protein